MLLIIFKNVGSKIFNSLIKNNLSEDLSRSGLLMISLIAKRLELEILLGVLK